MAGLCFGLAMAGCADDGPIDPGTLRFGQIGLIRATLHVPLRLGVGTLTQTLEWSSRGPWTLHERISYRGLVGDETLFKSPGEPGQFAGGYAGEIALLNDVEGVRIVNFPELDPDTVPSCGEESRTRIVFTIRDDARKQEITWTRCAVGAALHDITPVDAGHDAGAARIVQAIQRARDETIGALGSRFSYAYLGSVPYGTLARGDDSDASLPAPLVIDDAVRWTSFWADHAPGTTRPTVDFAVEHVIVGAVGERTEAGDSVEVRRIVEVDNGTLVELFERVPGDFCTPAARLHTPFHIVVAPRTSVPLRFADIRVEEVPCGG